MASTKFKCEKLKNGNVRTCEVRLAYVNLLKPRDNNGRMKFSAALLFPEGADISILKKEAERVGKEKFGDKFETLWKAGKIRSPFKDQSDNIDDSGDLRPGFKEGCIFISASANEDRRPPVIDAQMNPLVDIEDVYSGMWARCSIRAFAYDTEGNRGISFGLQAVQKLWDDESLGGPGRVNVDNEFDPVEVEEGQSADSVFD